METYNAKPTLLEYFLPWGQATYYGRLDELEWAGLISKENPQTLRQMRQGFFAVPVANLMVLATAVAGLIKLVQ